MPHFQSQLRQIYFRYQLQDLTNLITKGILTGIDVNGVKKVLMTNVDCLLKEWTCGPNFVSVECELYAKILYAEIILSMNTFIGKLKVIIIKI